ncbi:transmembrane protein, putative [Bodo saltans]|uniref:Transmembrane protein, putative n=1 Tax=Bodo saltans TaxID=75058 RepID=A0A0S4IVA6_BODSA|nr:transmembrane protein, putative [Bodo saltans]|eukprot:CUF84679.1 transmembrane protein, putative [Bodo saltans]
MAAIFDQIAVKDLTVSAAFGACVGVAAKKLTKDAMYGVGLGFIGLQTLSYLGYVSIDWGKVEKDIIKAVDQNNDGKFDKDDAVILSKKALEILKKGLPNAAGFTTGFAVGVKFL